MIVHRVGGMLVRPRALLSELSEGTGKHDGAWLLLAWLLAVGVPELGEGLADLRALGGLEGALGLAQGLWPVLQWLAASAAVEWLLGPTRAHRAALCLVPMLVVGALGHLLLSLGLTLPGARYLPLVAAAIALIFTAAVRPAISPVPTDMSPRTGTRASLLVGLVVAALVSASAARDLVSLVRAWPTLAPTGVGDALPEFTAPLLGGGALTTADLQGRAHLLVFWTTWCGVCEAEMPMYSALAGRHPELRVIGVNADRDGDVPALARAYRDSHALPFPIALDDGRMTRGFRVRMYPHIVLVDAAGQIRGVFRGRTSARTLDAAIARLTSS